MIRLTEKEIFKAIVNWDDDNIHHKLPLDVQFDRVAQAQLKKFREWLKSEVLEDCHEGYSNVMCFHKRALRELEDDCKA